MPVQRPKVVVLAGPNGAGKTTAAPKLLRGAFDVEEFVNADMIAQGLSAFAPQRAALAAGRIMLRRIHDLAQTRTSFAFETTLASRTFAPWFRRLIDQGYEFQLIYLWLPTPEAAIARVQERVRLGGHDVPQSTIRRRYAAGLRNFFDLYRPLASRWQVMDNSRRGRPKLIANGTVARREIVYDQDIWNTILGVAGR